MNPADGSGIEMLRVANLHAFYGESHILHGIDFTVNRGEVITLLGRNGAGRTTTLRAVLGAEISPELVPGAAAQSTEAVVGPYELQDFNLYWLTRYGAKPSKILFLAWSAWRDKYSYPELRGFNFQGGIAVQPELMALLLGLSTYTASFIAEIVRAGILGVPKGQTEAAQAVGLSNALTLRLVVIPQASRIIIPPLTSQYLNLTKNSSLAVAIGYPDFVSVFTGTVLNQTGQAVEVILMTMGVFLSLSLATSLFMNWFNRRMALVER